MIGNMLTKKQYSAIAVNAIIVKMLLTYPHFLITNSGNAAWLTVLMCTMLALILFGIVRFFYTENYNIIELADRIGGTGLRIITGLAVFVLLGLNISQLIYDFPKLIRLVLLQGTYTEYIGLAFMITLILGSLCGIQSLGRVHELMFPISCVFIIAFFLLLLPSIEIDNIFPILGKGAENVFVKGVSGISIFTDVLLLNLLMPHVKNLEEYKKGGIKAIIIGGVFAIAVMVMYGICYAYPVSEKFLLPVYQLERLIHLSNFFSRFEAVFQFIWSIQIILYGCVYIAVLSEVWQTTFRLNKNAPIIMSIAVTVLGASLLPGSITTFAAFEESINRWLYIPAFLMPIIFGLIYKVKNNK